MPPDRLINLTIRITLLVVLIATPWLFGGVWARVQWVLLFVGAMLLAVDLLRRLADDQHVGWIPTAWLPLLAGVLLGLAQLVPLSGQLGTWLAPNAQKLRQQLLEEPSGRSRVRSRAPEERPIRLVRTVRAADEREGETAESEELFEKPAMPASSRTGSSRSTRTLYPLATREYLALLVLASGVFVLASRYLCDNRAVLWMQMAIGITGGVLAFFGVVQKLSSDGATVYWVLHPIQGGNVFGPFVNRNNAGGFLNMCLAAALGLLVLVHTESRSTRRAAGRESGEGSGPGSFRRSRRVVSVSTYTLSTSRATLLSSVVDYIGSLNARRGWSVALVGCIAGGVLCTASRGSILALVAAILIAASILSFRTGHRGFAIALLVTLVAGLGLMSWSGQTETVRARFEQMFDDPTLASGGRLPNWTDALQTVPDFWGWGTGLGTYRYIYERFQYRFLYDVAHFHAENQYIQGLVEGGVVALALLAAMIFLVLWSLRCLFRTGGSTNLAVAVMGTFGLTTQMVGGAFDFGLYIPSNTLLLAALCGMVVGRAVLTATGDSVDQRLLSGRLAARVLAPRAPLLVVPMPALAAPLVVGFLGLGCLFGSLELHKAAQIERAVRAVMLAQVHEEQSPQVIRELIERLVPVLPHRWDDADAHRHLAELWMQLYQATTYQQLLGSARAADAGSSQATQPASGQVGGPASKATESPETTGDKPPRDEELWARSSVWHLHRTIRMAQQRNDQQTVRAIVTGPAVREFLAPAWRHLLHARYSCPLSSQVHYLLAEVSAAVDPASNETVHLRRAVMLAPGNATLLYWSGVLHLDSGRIDQAMNLWSRSLALSNFHLADMMQSASGQLTLEQLLDGVLPQRSDVLLDVAVHFYSGQEQEPARRVILEHAARYVGMLDVPPDQKAYVAGTIYRLLGRLEEAASELTTAVEKNSTQERWRFECAQVLFELGRYDEAHHHARKLALARPDSAAYHALLKRINAQRARSAP